MRRIVRLSISLGLSLALTGCAGLSGLGASQRSAEREFDATAAVRRRLAEGPMTQTDLELYFGTLVDAIEGPPGAIRTQVDGVEVFLISDPRNDQMRMVVRIAPVSKLDPRFFRVLLQANFDATGDARYAISNGVVFATYLHPISLLTPQEIESALEQVVQLQKTFGTTYTSQPDALPAELR